MVNGAIKNAIEQSVKKSKQVKIRWNHLFWALSSLTISALGMFSGQIEGWIGILIRSLCGLFFWVSLHQAISILSVTGTKLNSAGIYEYSWFDLWWDDHGALFLLAPIWLPFVVLAIWLISKFPLQVIAFSLVAILVALLRR
jgi:hypothetical protein